MDLRPYQQRAIDDAIAALSRNPVVVVPTGGGKTFLGVRLAQKVAERTLWVAHRRELIHQAADAVREAGGRVGLILSGEPADRDAPFQIASVQTLVRRDLPRADLLVIDEAHHATSESYQRLRRKYPRRLGLTATPFRLDGKGLREAGFDEIVVGATVAELCGPSGPLHNPTVYALAAPDVSKVQKVAGDYSQAGLAKIATSQQLNGNVIDTWRKRADGKRTVVFAINIAHGEQLVARFVSAGVKAEMVTGKTPREERDGALARLRAGITKVVVNCMVLTEGWDLPALEVASVARPTASLCLHRQMLGRIMRSADGKDGAIVLDHAGNYARHGLVTDEPEYSLDTRVRTPSDDEHESEPMSTACPKCGRVAAASTKTCECGHVFVPTTFVTETGDDLLAVNGDHKREPFCDRASRWNRFYFVARGRVAARGTNMANLFDIDQDKVLDLATAMYHGVYAEWPLAVGPSLIHPARATPVDLMALRERWRRVGKRKGWGPDKVEWFARKCESDMRLAADKETAA